VILSDAGLLYFVLLLDGTTKYFNLSICFVVGLFHSCSVGVTKSANGIIANIIYCMLLILI